MAGMAMCSHVNVDIPYGRSTQKRTVHVIKFRNEILRPASFILRLPRKGCPTDERCSTLAITFGLRNLFSLSLYISNNMVINHSIDVAGSYAISYHEYECTQLVLTLFFEAAKLFGCICIIIFPALFIVTFRWP